MKLTGTEQLVLEQVAHGASSKAISTAIGKSEDAVKRIRRQLLAKLGAPTMAAAVARGYDRGLLGTVRVEEISDGQLRAFHAKAGSLDKLLGYESGAVARQVLEFASEIFGREITSVRDLTAREANTCLDHLQARQRERR